jgi:hypothetical protein
MRRASLLSLLFALAAVAGCANEGLNGNNEGPPDAATPADAAQPPDMTFQSAAHTPLPAMPNGGGPVIAHVELVTITFAGFSREQDVISFGDWVVGSSWLSTVGAEYGVGTGTHQHVLLSTAAPAKITSPGIGTFLSQQITMGALPPADPQRLYMIFFPPETDITDNQLNCAYFKDQATAAWHFNVTGSPAFAYAVVPTCKTEELGQVEHAAAHELIEAATDPLPYANPTYQFPSSAPWAGEVADLCDQEIIEEGHSVGRVWSNAAATAGGDPCIPSDGSVYFNVSITPDEVHMLSDGQAITLDVTGWSTGPTGDWSIMPFTDNGSVFDPLPMLTKTTIGNGGKAQLTVSVPDFAQSGSWVQLVVYSQLGSRSSFWPVVIQVP